MQVWVVVFELSLLVVVLVKLGWDIVVYRQSGRLPWVARHLCFWSVPGISTARYTVHIPTYTVMHPTLTYIHCNFPLT